jgi:PAS domain S-box-containing protein
VELARLRVRQARWRTALVDSLQEGFFVCDELGTVTEINSTFTGMLGYGAEGLPYAPAHPWWPDEQTDSQAYHQTSEAFRGMLTRERGACTVPALHRDGHRLWVTVTFTHVRDPETGRRVIVGTVRDVTDEHYTVQRDMAVAAISLRLTQATDLRHALSGALEELRTLWHAREVVAAIGDGPVPTITATNPTTTWESLTDRQRGALGEVMRLPMFVPAAEPGTGIGLEHPQGPMAVWVDLGDRRPFTDQDRVLLAQLSGQITQGLARVHQSDQQRETVLALQSAILGPAHLPGGFAVRYEPATPPLQVGGDWYDVVALPDGRLGIIVGDCVGRGLKAASVMGQMRSACRALLLQDPHPERALTALDRFVADTDGALCTSVFCGVLDPRTGHLAYSSAGHPPGILVYPDGTTTILQDGLSPVLGIAPDVARTCATHVLPARATLLLYSDGLVERRRQPLTDGIDQAARALHEGRNTGVEELATHVMRGLAPISGYDDDVALLLYRHPGPLDIAFEPQASALAPVRNALRDWLERSGVPEDTAQGILVAAGEACANAVEHGHRDSPDVGIRLRAEALTERVDVRISDSGSWKAPQAEPHRGHGINLMRTLMDQVTITPTAHGTTVDMHVRIAA